MKIEVKIKSFKNGSKEFKCSSIDPIFDENKSKDFNFTLSLNQLNEIENLNMYVAGILQAEVTFKTIETHVDYNYDPLTGSVIPIIELDVLPVSKKKKKGLTNE